jgi:uncharacterized protein
MNSILHYTKHRPWPLPNRKWFMFQTWQDLLFAHWPIEVDKLRHLIPAGLEIDTYSRTAWVSLTVFGVNGTRLRWTPPVPGLSSYNELNFRTYVQSALGKPGTYFLSIGVTKRLIAEGAQRFFRLPYVHADISALSTTKDRFAASCRMTPDLPFSVEEEFRCQYRPVSNSVQIQQGSLENWLYDRYCLYTCDPTGNILIGEIHHPPWILQQVETEIEHNTIGRSFGIELSTAPSLLTYTNKLDTVTWTLEYITKKNMT